MQIIFNIIPCNDCLQATENISMINYKGRQKITAYIEYIKVHEDADYIGYFLNLSEEEQMDELNEIGFN